MSARQNRNGRKFGETGRAIVDVLQEHRITGYEFGKDKHAWVAFPLHGRTVVYTFACSPRSETGNAKRCRRELAAMLGGRVNGLGV